MVVSNFLAKKIWLIPNPYFTRILSVAGGDIGGCVETDCRGTPLPPLFRKYLVLFDLRRGNSQNIQSKRLKAKLLKMLELPMANHGRLSLTP
jgi:hypothetical protein